MPFKYSLSALRWVLGACIGAVILSSAGYLIVWAWFGAPEAAWALLQGQDIVVVPGTVDLGDCPAGDARELKLRVVNLSSTRVTVTGMHTSCSCVLASTLPLVLEPRGASTLRITIHASGEQGAFARHAVLYTDSKASPQLPITVVGKIYGEERGGALAPTPQEAVASKAP